MRRRWWCVVVAGMAVSAGAEDRTPADVMRLIEVATPLLMRGQDQAVIQKLEPYQGGHATVLYLLASAYAKTDQADKAFEVLGRIDSATIHPQSYDQAIVDPNLNALRKDPRLTPFLDTLKKGAEDAERTKHYWIPVQKTIEHEGRTFEIVGKPTDKIPKSARQVTRLCPFRGRLYLGYGDGNNNLGPLGLNSFDPKTGTFMYHFPLQEHSVSRFRLIGDEVWIPGEEPYEGIEGKEYMRNYELGNLYRLLPDGGYVKMRTVPYTYHMNDVAKLGDVLFCSIGADAGGRPVGRVCESRDGGIHWKTAYDFPAPAMRGATPRAGVMVAYRGALYAFGFALGSQNGQIMQVPDPFGPRETFRYDGTAWSRLDLIRGDQVVDVRSADVYGEWMLLNVFHVHEDQGASSLFKSDGTTSQVAYAKPGRMIRDVAIVGQDVYLLVGLPANLDIQHSADLKTWNRVCAVPEKYNVTALAVMDGALYLGTDKGTLLRTTLK